MADDSKKLSGGGGISFETQKFAFGQRIAVRTDTTSTEVLAETIDRISKIEGEPLEILETLFGAGADTGDGGATFGYDPSQKWLAGADVTLRGLTLRMLFVDTSFYGIGIEFAQPDEKGGSGGGKGGDPEKNGGDEKEKKSPFDGLRLEVLYRKINDRLGVYSGDLSLPDRFRTISLGVPPGAATLTLPAVGIEIFTNGDFRISVGWPLGKRSIAIQFPPNPIPWAGAAGFHFGKLSSAVDPGALGTDFDPIIEFGIGLAIGAATEGNVSILKYKASLYLFGTFEGLLAWSKGSSFDQGLDYYWFSATVGITGHLEGGVDFAVIKASVSLALTASVSLALETGHVTRAQATFRVTASAKIKVLFITVHYSFSLTLTKRFALGSGAPIARISGPTPPTSRALAAAPLAAVPLARDTLLGPAAEAFGVDGARDGASSRAAFVGATSVLDPADKADIKLLFLLQPSVLGDAPERWRPAAVATLVIERAAPRTSSGDDPFCTLVQGIAYWLHDNLGDSRQDFAERLQDVSKAILAGRFDAAQVERCLQARFTFTIEGMSASSAGREPVDGALFPLFPALEVSYDGNPAAFPGAPTPGGYAAELDHYFAQLSLWLASGAAPRQASAASTGPTPGAIVFADYFALLARQLFHELEDVAEVAGVSDLASALAKIDYGNLAGMVTRFMVHGLRVPSPTDRSRQIGIASLTGQQLELVPRGGDWVRAASLSVRGGSTGATIGFAPDATSARAELGTALTDGPTPGPLWKPTALAPLVVVPLKVLMPTGIACSLADGAGTAATHRLLAFPEPLTDLVREQEGVALRAARVGDSETEDEPTAAAPTLLARFSLARVPDPAEPGTFVENVYRVFGTDDTTRERLFGLLSDAGALAEVTLDMLLPLAAGGFAASADDASAWLVKTNLSTLNRPPTPGAARARTTRDIGPSFASPGDVEAFLRLLWEVSVVHAGGFFLHVTDLDAELFSSAERVGVAVLARFAAARPREETSAVEVDTFHNALLVAAPDAPAGGRVAVDVLDRHSHEALPGYRPNYPPGCVGFGASWDTPPNAVDDHGGVDLANALYHLLQFRVIAGGGYEGSNWSLPIGAQSERNDSTWTYRQAFAPHRLLGQRSANRYAAIGQPLEVALQLLDIYGNAVDSSMTERGELANLQLTPTYNDRLIAPGEWPGVGFDFRFLPEEGSDTAARLELNVSFDPDQVVGPAPVRVPSQAARDALETFTSVHEQLSDPNVRLSLTTSLAEGPVALGTSDGEDLATALGALIEAVRAYLSSLAGEAMPGGDVPPPPLRLSGTVDRRHVATLPADLFTVDVSLGIGRERCTSPDGGAPPDPKICAVDYRVSPRLGDPSDARANSAPATLERFAEHFELAFLDFAPGARLKLLAGHEAQPSLGRSADPSRLWAIRWGGGVGIDVEFPNDGTGAGRSPVYFAPLPLSTRLREGAYEIATYDEASGECVGETRERLFSRIDMDAWAREFLRAFDALLVADMATAIAALDGASYATLMRSKEQIARAFKRRLTNVLAAQAGAGDRQAAADRFEQTLRVRLSNGYSTSAVVQLPVSVAVGHANGGSERTRPPELYGDVVPRDPATGTARPFDVSPAALPIVPGEAMLTCLVSTSHPTERANLDLELDYTIGFVDHLFETEEREYGYVPSSWLRFVLPKGPGGGAPVLELPTGKVSVPIPLRAFPPTPSVVHQSAAPTNESPTDIASALRWTYVSRVARPSAAQDTLHLSVRFNRPPKPSGTSSRPAARGEAAREPPSDLLEALARFVAEYPAIEPQLDLVKRAAFDDGDAPLAKRWLAAAMDLIVGVAGTWDAWPTGEGNDVPDARGGSTQASGPPQHAWTYRIAIPNENEPTQLTVVREPVGSTPHPPPWPTIDGAPVRGEGAEGNCTLPADGIELVLAWEALDVIARQSADTTVHVVRNADFANGPSNRGFQYVTPAVCFSSPLVPLIEVSHPIECESKSTLEAALVALYRRIVEHESSGGEVIVDQDVGYEYELGKGGALTSRVPVFLADGILGSSDGGVAEFAESLAQALGEWHAAFGPTDRRADIASALTLIATITERRLPLVRFEELRIRVPPGEDRWWGEGGAEPKGLA